MIEAINERIYRFDQKIALVHYDPTDMDFYVFVSLQESPIDLQQNVFTAPELHFFRVLLRELALSEDHTLALIACLNLTNDTASEGMKPLAKTRAEQLLQEWEQLGYFLTLDDKCYLGPKAVVEFEKYITRNYADVVTRCCLCNVTIFYVSFIMLPFFSNLPLSCTFHSFFFLHPRVSNVLPALRFCTRTA